MKIKSKREYEVNKTYFNKKYNHIWKKWAGRPFLGSCSYLFLKYRPTTYQEFFDRYTADFDDISYNPETCIGDKHKGRSVEQMMNLAKRYFADCNDPNITLEMCFDDIVNHAIIETFDGHQVELMLTNILSKYPDKYIVEAGEDDLDARYGVDIVVRDANTNKVKHFIQVKPITTFLGTSNYSLISDRKNFYNKHRELKRYLINEGREEDSNVEIEYMCYDKQHYERTKEAVFLVKPNGSKMFRLSELCDREGMPLFHYNECKFETLKDK